MESKLFQLVDENDLDGTRKLLQNKKVFLDCRNLAGERVLHVACRLGLLDFVKLLMEFGVHVDMVNVKGETSLHVAIQSGHTNIALHLIRNGAFVDAQNADGDSAIHLASRKGMLLVVQALCQIGCSLDALNNQGYFPLYLAARHGHSDVIRCLILYGSNIEQRTPDGIQAEITAFKHYQYDAGDLLYKLRNFSQCENYINQLVSNDIPISKMCIKFIGPPNSGKTTLIRSLKAGYFIGLFARSKSQQSSNGSFGKSSPSSPKKSWTEMEMTSHQPFMPFKVDFPNYDYTKGIEIHHTNFGSCEVSMWDFSGFESYYQIYDLFLGDTTSLYILTINLSEPSVLQHYLSSYWLSFLLARFRPNGNTKSGLKVILVGTNADKARLYRDAQGAFKCPLAQQLRDRLALEFPSIEVRERILLVDAHLSNSQGVRDVKGAIIDWSHCVLQGFEKTTKFVETVVENLPNWRKEYELFPAISFGEFLSRIRKQINPLTTFEHVKQLLEHLEIMGEAILLKSEEDDIIVLDLNWLCSEIIGGLLSFESITRARLTGCYTEEDFQSAFPQAPADLLLPVLVSLNLCTKCEDDDGEFEYEFPCLNLVEKIDGLWSSADERYNAPDSCYGGIRLKASFKLFQTIFSRIQVQLRRTTISCQDPDGDLYQWYHGSKLCAGDIEGIITLEQDGQVVDVKVRGTNPLRLACFYFMEEILAIIEQVVLSATPGVMFEKHILSSLELKMHCDTPFCWRPEHAMTAVLSGINTSLHNPLTDKSETLVDLIAFGSTTVEKLIILGGDLSVKELSPGTLHALSRLLDPAEPLGRDWCLLAVKLGLDQKVSVLEAEMCVSKTMALIDFWALTGKATVGNLIEKLMDCGREDAAELLKQSAPLYRIDTTTQSND